MKSRIAPFISIVFFLLHAPAGTAQDTLTAGEWQADLRYLQETVHRDYPFLFKKISASEFDRQVDELHEEIPTLEPHEILVGLARIVSLFKYGHTVLGYWEGVIPYHQLPVVLYHYDDGIFLQGVHRRYEALAGTKLLAIEGMPVADVLSRMRPVVPAENDMFVKAYGIRYLTFPEFLHAQGVIPELKNEVSLTLGRGEETFEATVEAVPAERFPRRYGMVIPGPDWVESRDSTATPLYLKNLDKIYFYEPLPQHGAVYVRHSQIADDPEQNIPAFYHEVFEYIEENKVEKLILDLRLNGGGNNYKNKPIVTGLIKSRINKPGGLMVIIGRRTFSACQNLVNEIHNYTHAVFVGEPTGENINFYGDNQPVSLPNSGLNAYLSFAWWQDKPQWENADWLAPQIATPMTFEHYRSNKDPALEAALAFRDSTYIADPMGHLTELFTRGEIARVQSEAARMIADTNYAYFDFLGEFNEVSEKLLNSGSVGEALFVTTMNVGFFPESPEAWLIHAKVLLAKGEREEAQKSLRKVLDLEAAEPVRSEAEELLRQL